MNMCKHACSIDNYFFNLEDPSQILPYITHLEKMASCIKINVKNVKD